MLNSSIYIRPHSISLLKCFCHICTRILFGHLKMCAHIVWCITGLQHSPKLLSDVRQSVPLKISSRRTFSSHAGHQCPTWNVVRDIKKIATLLYTCCEKYTITVWAPVQQQLQRTIYRQKLWWGYTMSKILWSSVYTSLFTRIRSLAVYI